MVDPIYRTTVRLMSGHFASPTMAINGPPKHQVSCYQAIGTSSCTNVACGRSDMCALKSSNAKTSPQGMPTNSLTDDGPPLAVAQKVTNQNQSAATGDQDFVWVGRCQTMSRESGTESVRSQSLGPLQESYGEPR
ncbi:MAG: hypothetical protein ACJAZO_003928 [Myxococcota bacterium]|jgi:hypothetical protein